MSGLMWAPSRMSGLIIIFIIIIMKMIMILSIMSIMIIIIIFFALVLVIVTARFQISVNSHFQTCLKILNSCLNHKRTQIALIYTKCKMIIYRQYKLGIKYSCNCARLTQILAFVNINKNLLLYNRT